MSSLRRCRSTALTEAAEIAISSYDQAVDGYLSKNIEHTNEIIDRRVTINELYHGVTPLPVFGDSNETSVLSDVINIRESIKNISHHAARIAELTIDRAYRINTDLKKELNLSLISKDLLLENVDYEPDQFPGLIYRMDDIGASLLLFSSGKIVCTGTKNIEDATNAIEMIKEKPSSLGVL